MQEEITKHGRKIYKTAKNNNHSLGEKLKEIIIEVLIIVFAVTLSISLHSWAEHRHEQKEVREFLSGLKNDLGKDIKLIEQHKNIIAGLNANYHFLSSLANNRSVNNPADTIPARYFSFEIPVTQPNIGRYEGFKSSGKIGSIEARGLKESILVYYQQTMPDLVYGENYVNTVQLKIMDLFVDRNDKMPVIDFIRTRKMQSLLLLCINNFEVNLKAYDRALEQVKKIITEIDKETGD